MRKFGFSLFVFLVSCASTAGFRSGESWGHQIFSPSVEVQNLACDGGIDLSRDIQETQDPNTIGRKNVGAVSLDIGDSTIQFYSFAYYISSYCETLALNRKDFSVEKRNIFYNSDEFKDYLKRGFTRISAYLPSQKANNFSVIVRLLNSSLVEILTLEPSRVVLGDEYKGYKRIETFFDDFSETEKIALAQTQSIIVKGESGDRLFEVELNVNKFDPLKVYKIFSPVK